MTILNPLKQPNRPTGPFAWPPIRSSSHTRARAHTHSISLCFSPTIILPSIQPGVMISTTQTTTTTTTTRGTTTTTGYFAPRPFALACELFKHSSRTLHTYSLTHVHTHSLSLVPPSTSTKLNCIYANVPFRAATTPPTTTTTQATTTTTTQATTTTTTRSTTRGKPGI